MAWYWWLLLGIVAIVVINVILHASARPAPAKEDPDTAFSPLREEMAVRDAEGERVLALVLDLPVVAEAGPGDTQSRAQVSANVMKMARTPHVRTHAVWAPDKLTFVQEFGHYHDKAFAREFVRTGEDRWRVRTQAVDNFDAAVAVAEAGEAVAPVTCEKCGRQHRLSSAVAKQGKWTCGACERAARSGGRGRASAMKEGSWEEVRARLVEAVNPYDHDDERRRGADAGAALDNAAKCARLGSLADAAQFMLEYRSIAFAGDKGFWLHWDEGIGCFSRAIELVREMSPETSFPNGYRRLLNARPGQNYHYELTPWQKAFWYGPANLNVISAAVADDESATILCGNCDHRNRISIAPEKRGEWKCGKCGGSIWI